MANDTLPPRGKARKGGAVRHGDVRVQCTGLEQRFPGFFNCRATVEIEARHTLTAQQAPWGRARCKNGRFVQRSIACSINVHLCNGVGVFIDHHQDARCVEKHAMRRKS